MKSSIKFSGAVLAGGKSSRFGEDKALYIYQGKTLMTWVIESLAEAHEIFAVAPQEFADIKTYQDIIPSGNSLSGLHTALSYAKYDWVAVAACDLPFLRPTYWQLLLEHTSDTQLVIAENALGQLEPLAALYHRSVLPIVEQQLKTGDLTIKHISEKVSCKRIPWSELKKHFDNHLFLNANYKTDLP